MRLNICTSSFAFKKPSRLDGAVRDGSIVQCARMRDLRPELGHPLSILPDRWQRHVFKGRDDLRHDEVARVVDPLWLAEFSERVHHRLAADERHVGDGDGPARIARVSDQRRRCGIGADCHDRVGMCGSEDVHLRLQACREGRPSAIGGLARDREPMAREGLPDPFPSPSSIGIGLIEHGDPSSPHPDKVIDQSLRLLAIGGPQVEH